MESVSFLFHVSGPREAGPGERQGMLDRATAAFSEAGVASADIVRVDVPGRGQSEASDATIRPEVDPVVPALQSGSLFGDITGVLVVDAQSLRASEASAIADLLEHADRAALCVVLVASGSIPAPLGAFVKKNGQLISVRKMRERDATDWVRTAARERKMKVPADSAQALVERFGSDIGSLGHALDQLSVLDEAITPELVRDRFRNRPDEPMWHFTDAVTAGDVGGALRRLHDFLTHSHPLVLLAFLENDLRKRSLAAAAPDIDTFASWSNSKPDAFPTKKAWQGRSRVSTERLSLAVDALRRADQSMKTTPEETHQVTLERLTVALCHWYGSNR